jgi:hypothetical protein
MAAVEEGFTVRKFRRKEWQWKGKVSGGEKKGYDKGWKYKARREEERIAEKWEMRVDEMARTIS